MDLPAIDEQLGPSHRVGAFLRLYRFVVSLLLLFRFQIWYKGRFCGLVLLLKSQTIQPWLLTLYVCVECTRVLCNTLRHCTMLSNSKSNPLTTVYLVLVNQKYNLRQFNLDFWHCMYVLNVQGYCATHSDIAQCYQIASLIHWLPFIWSLSIRNIVTEGGAVNFCSQK